MKKCHSCGSTKPLDCFGSNRSNDDGKQPYCKDCSKLKDKKHYERSAKRRALIRERNEQSARRYQDWVLSYLEDHSCVDCGETDPIVLDFDHKHDKNFDVSVMKYHSLERVQEEVKKCEVRCANCHRRKTARENNYYRYLRIAGSTLLS